MEKLMIIIILSTISSNCLYQQNLAKYFSCLSAVSYQKSTIISAWDCQFCLISQLQHAKLIYDESQSVQGYTAYWPKQNAIVVVFRGNIDYNNLFNSLLLIRVPYNNCQQCSVHSGFLYSYQAVSSQVISQIQTLFNKYPVDKIYAMGHSRGGALALLSALDIKLKYNKPTVLYSFGQPRVGNHKFAEYSSIIIPQKYRIINNRDGIPHIFSTAIGYKHAGYQILYSYQNSYIHKICQAQQQNSCSNNYWFFQYNSGDHPVMKYVTMLGGKYIFYYPQHQNLRSYQNDEQNYNVMEIETITQN